MSKTSKNNLLLSSLKRVLQMLPDKFRTKGIIVMVLLLVNSVLDLLGLAAILPLFTVILEDNIIQTNVYLSSIYNFFNIQSEENFVFLLSMIIIIIIITKNLISLAIHYYKSRFCFSLYKYYCTSLHRHYYTQGYAFLSNINSNDIVRNISAVPYFNVMFLVLPLLMILSEVLVLAFVVVALFLFDPKIIGLLAIIVAPAFVLFYNGVKNKIAFLQEDEHRLDGETRKTLYQSIFGYSDVEINNNAGWFFNIYKDQVTQKARNQSLLYTFNQAPFKVVETAMILAIIIVVIYGVYTFDNKKDLIILLSGLALAAYRILPSFNRILSATISIKGVQYTLDILSPLKDMKPWIERKYNPIAFEKGINFKNLTFQYDGSEEKVLNDLSLSIKKGESIGIIGKSGSGKTTLVKVLMRFLVENSGTIEIDGVAINEKNTEALRDLMGYVQQEVFILDGTIADNIAFGVKDENIDVDLLHKVVERASLKKIIDQLPNGLDTQIGERGSHLSGGQRQRVGIARSLYSGAKILIFDEATSALDSETEDEITEAIKELKEKDLTMLIVAHRLSTLKYCDRIIELQHGSVKGIHQYAELTH